MKKEDIEFLNQLIISLDDAGKKLEYFYNKKDAENFNKVKKFILQLQTKISETI